jgi:hypothetical protein
MVLILITAHIIIITQSIITCTMTHIVRPHIMITHRILHTL